MKSKAKKTLRHLAAIFSRHVVKDLPTHVDFMRLKAHPRQIQPFIQV